MRWFRSHYMEWDEYSALVSTMDDFLWRQRVRERGLAT